MAVAGGSQTYVRALTAPFADRIQIQTPIMKVLRHPDKVEVMPRGRRSQFFDQVIFATHADQTLEILGDADPLERDILESFPFQKNVAVLHTDTSVLPKKKLAWAAWNYHLLNQDDGRVALTYNMNILQNLDAPETFCVTLNCEDAINPTKIIRRIVYHHPIFTQSGVENQTRHREISGKNRTHFAGAYWFNGFHEDGVRSGQRVANHILGLPDG
jgi:predicted NAD/FAD-binding protein